MKQKSKLWITILSIAIFILIVLSPLIYATHSKDLTWILSKKYGSEQRLGESAQILNSNIIEFFNGAELNNTFTTPEKNHLTDVKHLLNTATIIFGICLLIIISAIIFNKEKSKNIFKKAFLYSGISALVFNAIIIIFTLFSFDSLFISFHELLFPQGNWTFPASSLLIQLYPEEFFTEIGTIIFVTSIVLAIIFIIIGICKIGICKIKQKNKSKKLSSNN